MGPKPKAQWTQGLKPNGPNAQGPTGPRPNGPRAQGSISFGPKAQWALGPWPNGPKPLGPMGSRPKAQWAQGPKPNGPGAKAQWAQCVAGWVADFCWVGGCVAEHVAEWAERLDAEWGAGCVTRDVECVAASVAGFLVKWVECGLP